MIVCKGCNQENEDEAAFCGNCGAYLEWEGERIEAAAPPARIDEPEPEDDSPGLIERLKEAVGIAGSEGRGDAPGEAALPAAETPTEPALGSTHRGDAAGLEPAAPAAPMTARPEPPPVRDAAIGGPPVAAAAETPTAPAERAPTRPAPPPPAPTEPAPAAAGRDGTAAPNPRGSIERASQAVPTMTPPADREPDALSAAPDERLSPSGDERTPASGPPAVEPWQRAPAQPAADGDPGDSALLVPGETASAPARGVPSSGPPTAGAPPERPSEISPVADAPVPPTSPPDAPGLGASEPAPAADPGYVDKGARPTQPARPAAPFESELEPPKKPAPSISAMVAKPPVRPTEPSPGLAATTEGSAVPAAATAVAAPEQPDVDGPLGPRKPEQPPIGAKKPAEQKRDAARRKKRRPMDVATRPGDLICGQCGEPNDPTRKFCRRCANPLLGAEVAGKQPWWRRLFSRGRKPVPAGGRSRDAVTAEGKPRKTKAGRRSFGGILRQILALLLVAFVLTAFLVPSLRSAATDRVRGVYDFFRCLVQSCDVPLSLEAATASSSLRAHDALNAVDGGTNTFWAAADDSTGGRGQWLCVDFGRRTDLTNVGFFVGARDKQGALTRARPRPRDVALVFRKQACRDDLRSSPALGADSRTIELSDSGDEVFRKLDGKDVRSVQIIVVSAFPGQKDDHVAIAEVEFFTRP